jgi:uncharacterized protein (DUF433 family)
MIPAGILLLVVVAGVSALIGAQIVRRQFLRDPKIPWGFNRSFAFGPRMGGRWMPFSNTGDFGPIHPLMLEAIAERLDLTIEDLIDRMQAGESLKDITEDQGLSLEELEELMRETHESGIEDCRIVEEWGDWMGEHMEGFGHHGRTPRWGGRGPLGRGPVFHFERYCDEQP